MPVFSPELMLEALSVAEYGVQNTATRTKGGAVELLFVRRIILKH